MSGDFEREIAPGVWLRQKFFTVRGKVTSFSVVLMVERDGKRHTVRIWDNAHGVNDMHRYTRSGGKQPAEEFHPGEFGAAYRAAYEHAEDSYPAIVESWDR